jgi:hypothetical protein
MRLEATVPDSRGQIVDQIAAELGLSRSQIVDEAIALFLLAFMEARNGRRLVAVDPREPNRERSLATPTLASLEWTSHVHPHGLGPEALAKMAEVTAAPPAPNARLRRAADRFKHFSKKRHSAK